METRKIALACFIGGALCSAVALFFSPNYWWLGSFAGLAGGYIAYEFREIFRAIPKAWHKAKGSGFGALNQMLTSAKQPHPILYSWLVFNLIIDLFLCFLMISDSIIKDKELFLAIFLILCPVPLTTVNLSLFLFVLTDEYMKLEKKSYWMLKKTLFNPDLTDWEIKARQRAMEKADCNGISITNSLYLIAAIKAIFWVAKGALKTVPTILKFLFWTMWKYSAIGLYKGLCFVGRFIWHLFKLIHSDKRLLCAIDGTLGGLASYQWLASSAMSSTEQVLVVIFGGLIGAVLGIVNWEFVSKRILHVATDNI